MTGVQTCALPISQYGLAEIKREVAAIECRLDNQSNQQLLALLAAVKGVVLCIQQKLENPEFGLEEIKSEVRGIEETLCDRHFGLPEIKDEIEDIECLLRKLDLEETLALLGAIEAEIAGLECKIDHICLPVDDLEEELAAIRCLLENPHFGLAEIKCEIEQILAGSSQNCDLSLVLALLQQIVAGLDDPEQGLAEIKAEIQEILAGQGGATVRDLTSGPVFRTNGANSIIVTVINNNSAAQAITIQAFARLPTQGGLPGSPMVLNVPAVTAAAVIFDLPSVVTAYEVRVSFSVSGSVSVFSASRTQNANAPVSSSNLLPENTIRDAEFRPMFFAPPPPA